MTGDEPVSIYATGHANNPDIAAIGDVDNIAVTVKFKDGAIGIVDQCRQAVYGYDQRLEVRIGKLCKLSIKFDKDSLLKHLFMLHHLIYCLYHTQVLGEHGMLTVDNAQASNVHHFAKNANTAPDIPFHWLKRYAEAYKDEIDHFIDVVLGILFYDYSIVFIFLVKNKVHTGP